MLRENPAFVFIVVRQIIDSAVPADVFRAVRASFNGLLLTVDRLKNGPVATIRIVLVFYWIT